MTSMTVAVHGATGIQGAAISERLVAGGFAVRALDSRSYDIGDVASVAQAYADVDAVVVQLPLVFGPVALEHAEALLAGLAAAQPRRVVLNPGMPLPPAPVGAPFVDARVLLAERLPSTVEAAPVVGPAGPYLENLLQAWSVRRVADHGELAYPIPAAYPVPWSALADLGDAIVAALRASDPPALTVVAGPEDLTGDSIAEAVTRASGRPVRWVEVSPGEYRELLASSIGAAAAAGVAAAYERMAAGSPPPTPPADLVSRGSTAVHDWAARQAWG